MAVSEEWITHPWVTASAKPRFGILRSTTGDARDLLPFVQQVEALGFDSYWGTDHTLVWRDGLTLLAAVATATTTIRLGTLVNCIYYRSPVLLARQAADVDSLSSGRLVLGLGIGWNAQEFAQLGLAMGSVRERQAALEEAVQIIKGLWGAGPVTLAGQTFAVAAADLPHKPAQQPRIPLLIAGGGERVTLRQVAQYADVANFGAAEMTGSAFTLDDVRRKLAALRRHCALLHRPYESVLRTHLTGRLALGTSPAELDTKRAVVPATMRGRIGTYLQFLTVPEAIESFRALVAAGIQYFIVGISPGDEETTHILAEQVIPAAVAP